MKKQNLSFNTTTAHFSALPASRPNGLNLLHPASEDLLPLPTLAFLYQMVCLYFGTPGPITLPPFWHSVQRVCHYSSILVPDGLPLLRRPCTKWSATTPDCLPRLKNPCIRWSASTLATLYQTVCHYFGIPVPDVLASLHQMVCQVPDRFSSI